MIKFKNVNKIWPNGNIALQDINVEISDGEFVGIIGLSGAGKTTLIKTVNKMHPISDGDLIVTMKDDKGEDVEYNVSNLSGSKLRKFKSRIGLITQEYNNVQGETVLNNVLCARLTRMPWYRKIFTIYTKEDKRIALDALYKLGILDKAYTRAGSLSGGQQQRVALARAISQEAPIIIADEPVSALDPIFAAQVMSDFEKINKEQNITILINIHHVELALKYTTRIIGVREGKVVYDGPTSKVDKNVLIQIYGENYNEEDIA
ncbi:phosphonate transport system ATP-binding protein [Spiroplasma sp. TIUS-1]|uniref:phosphonate ABC transporter ATP-binding protein n=1 Tax=Spiroplasma sp. TIUS-1 TaxID=216963 RepID=UPI001398BCB0|nr:phosphonate ABC transporter ATP-binding protein [Spiroplasma sp. TIUS-1]QHX36201.1 phosphonate transport system ATP-binding protein [Spiroplasma sp. TIUS-1]